MKRMVWRFQVAFADRVVIPMPSGADVLAVNSKDGMTIDLWALVEPHLLPEDRIFCVVGTGHPIRDDESEMRYCGTALLTALGMVFHVFEMVE